MLDLGESARRWLASGRRAVVVEVTQARGSVPRGPGTRMLVAVDEVQGTIGGGHLELKAIADARAMLAAGGPGGANQVREQPIALGPTLGQCCGGTLTLVFTPLQQAAPATWPAAAPRFTLQLYGAGHVGRAIVQLLRSLPCRVQWIDERELEFPSEPLPKHIEKVCVEPVEAEVRSAPVGCCFLVLTHSHDLDLAITRAILQRGDFAFFGLIGSKTKRARFQSRLRHQGLEPALIERMVCPIGLPGVEGKEPEVIALSVVAQLLTLRPASDGADPGFAGTL
jgi:xanthine dehydrogenase accessory factor